MAGTLNDLRFAARLALRRPALTLACVLTLALGVGANTTIVSVLQSVLLNPLGLRDADRVMVGRVRIDKLKMPDVTTSGVEFRELRAMTDTFGIVAAMEGRGWTSTGQGDAMRLTGQAVTQGFFDVFGETPALGRFPDASDRESVVLSNAFWRTQFGSDPGVLSRSLILDGKPHRVIGVARASFQFPLSAAIWTPLVLSPDRLQRRGMNMTLTVLARRLDSVSAAQSTERVRRYVVNLHQSGTAEGKDLAESGYWIELRSLGEFVAGDLRRPLLILWMASMVVLLAGCANIAALLLSRTASRAREMAIRLAAGATFGKVLRQLMLESLFLGLLGGAAGLGLASFGKKLLSLPAMPGGGILAQVKLDYTILFFGLGLALFSGLVFGLAPAVQLLRESQSSALARQRRRWFQDSFVVFQVGSAMVLLMACGLLLRSLRAVQSLQPGFAVEGLQTAYLLKPQNDPTFLTRLRPALAALPGAESAAMVYPLPFSGGGLTSGFRIRSRERAPGAPEWHGEAYLVSAGYFETLRIPLLRGRGIEESDGANAPLVCVIDAQMARRFFPGEEPLGQEIAMYRGWARIVGVAGAIRGTSLEEGSRAVVYYSQEQVPFFAQAGVVVRARQAPIREAVRQTNGSVAVFDAQSMEQRLDATMSLRRLVAALLSVFGGLCLVLAAVGLQGVIAQVVSERTREIGIRMALGARPGQVLASFLAQGARLVLMGLMLGSAFALFAQRWIRGLLYEVQPFDGSTLAVTAGLMVVQALGSAGWPAWRASRIDPQQALRVE